MNYPKLFKKTAKGQQYEWEIKVVIDKTNDKKTEDVFVCVEYGITNMKMMTTSRKVNKKYRHNTIYEHAVEVARKKWTDKQEKDGYSENIDDNTQWITPMLASAYSANKQKYPVMVQPKIDGFRCIATLNKNKVKLLSRNNVEYKGFATLKTNLSDYFNQLKKHNIETTNLYLDGELYIDSIPFEELSGLIKRGQYNADVDHPMNYLVFDCFYSDNLTLSFSERNQLLEKVGNYKNIVLIETEIINTEAELKKKFKQYMKDGYEGIMVRDMNGPYEISKRSKYLKKYKEFVDSEFEIVGFEEAEGTDKGTVIWVCITPSGETFNVRPKGTREYRATLLKNAKKYIGKKLTVIYQALSESGVPRFPVGKDIRN